MRLASLAIFLGGVAAGTGSTWATFTAASVTDAALQRVGGWNSGEPSATALGASLPERTPEAARVAAREVEKLSPRALARQALASTAFVRSGGVYGMGTLLDSEGRVVTCRHVIADAEHITVAFEDGTVLDARLVDSDEELDLALLSIGPTARPSLAPASIASVEAGDELFAIGAPRSMPFSLSRGMVSYAGRPFGRTFYLQTDLPMNAGNSGGPVLNELGEIVAIASFVLRDSEGLSFALPIDYAYRRFAAALVTPPAVTASPFEEWLTVRESAAKPR